MHSRIGEKLVGHSITTERKADRLYLNSLVMVLSFFLMYNYLQMLYVFLEHLCLVDVEVLF